MKKYLLPLLILFAAVIITGVSSCSHRDTTEVISQPPVIESDNSDADAPTASHVFITAALVTMCMLI
ncbi:MAG: hypothetical protein K2H48_08160 [Duncaniella sp.]|nr:hypothetical protein [Duncaniella sp.]